MRAPLLLALTLLTAPAAHADPLAALVTRLDAEARGWGRPGVQRDPALARAARILARRRAATIDAGALAAALEEARYFGGGPATLTLQSGRLDAAGIFEAQKTELKRQITRERFNRAGAARSCAGRRCFTVILLGEARIALGTVPESLEIGEAFTLEGRPLAPYRAPKLFMTGPDGRAHARPPVAGGIGEVACRAPGRLQVEVMGEGPGGPVILANLPIACGGISAVDLKLEAGPTEPKAAERYLLTRANTARAQQGLPALAWHPLAAEIARGHSKEMLSRGEVSHHSPATGDVRARADRAGLEAHVLAENLARAEDAGKAHFNLMSSPAHRAGILSREVHSIGVGVVKGPRMLWVTQVFVGDAPPVDLEAGRAQLRRHLEGAGLEEDPRLVRLAREAAPRLASGGMSRRHLGPWLQGRMKAEEIEYARLSLLTLEARAFDELSLADRMKGFERWGAASSPREGSLYVLVILIRE